jgi:hypothetical protein
VIRNLRTVILSEAAEGPLRPHNRELSEEFSRRVGAHDHM